jgi:hypothetical protein
MNASIDLGGPNDRLNVEEAREPLRLSAGIAGARLDVHLKASRSVPDDGTQYRIAATVHFGRVSHTRLMAARVKHEGTVTVGERAQDVTLTGFLSEQQLRAADALRADGPLWVTLTFDIGAVIGDPRGLRSFRGELSFPVKVGEWCEELERIDSGSWVELLVPMPANPDHAQMVSRVREARELLRAGDIDAALGAARLALEPARQEDLARLASPKKARERDLAERYAILIEDTYSVLCGAMHDDALTKTFRYSRAETAGLIATVAGLVHRYAAHS